MTGTTPATLGSELVTNGTFDSSTTGWTGSSTTLSAQSGWLRAESVSTPAFAYQAISTVVGKVYTIAGEWRSSAGTWRIVVGTSAGNTNIYTSSIAGSGTVDATFTATTTTTYVSVRSVTITVGDYVEIDNVTVKEVLTWADPKYYLDFDGVDDSLRAIFSADQAQPNTISAAFKFDVASRFEFMVDGYSARRHTLYKSSTNLGLFAGAAIFDSSAIGTVERVAFGYLNGASSDLRVDGLSVATGNTASQLWGGVTLGANSSPTAASQADCRIYGFVGVNRTLTAGEIDDVEAYLAAKSGVTLP